MVDSSVASISSRMSLALLPQTRLHLWETEAHEKSPRQSWLCKGGCKGNYGQAVVAVHSPVDVGNTPVFVQTFKLLQPVIT